MVESFIVYVVVGVIFVRFCCLCFVIEIHFVCWSTLKYFAIRADLNVQHSMEIGSLITVDVIDFVKLFICL